MLLSSAAQAYGEHLIAVILTGSGSDGAAGAVDVKDAGGVVIIQNPETAAYPSMPLSTTILRRIGRRMAVTHNTKIRDYADYLRDHPDEVRELVKAFLIKVTGFFRDPEAFEFIKLNIIPELIERSKGTGRTLRLWSAGCATGEEAYSLALLIADHLGTEFPEWNVKVFATDLAADAISFARRGLYPENVLSDLPEDYRDRFFERVDQGYRVSKALRQVVIFGQQDISRGVPFPRIDLVSCRNLLIYLKPDLQQVVLDLFAYSLHQSRGFLFLGKAETARPTKATFELVNKRWKIYRCMGGPLAFPVHDGDVPVGGATHSWRESRRRVVPAVNPAHDLTPADMEVAHLRRINETMLRYTNVAVVIIDRQYRILTINSTARRLLGVREIAYDQDFLHTVRGMPYQEMRRAIDTCFREHTTMTLPEVELDHSSEGSGRYVTFTIMIMQVEQGAPEVATITAFDVTDHVQLKKRFEAVQREHTDLVGELSATNKRFGTMNKELQDANEELQATNEELETNNEELQATNEELQTTNDEVTARTIELQELTKQYRVEQLQLSILLERFPHYVMVLDAEKLTVQAVNPAYQKLLGSRDVHGLPLTEILHGPHANDLLTAVKTALSEAQSQTIGPILASVDSQPDSTHYIHTVVNFRRQWNKYYTFIYL